MQQFFRKFSYDWAMTFSGALAYSLLTAMLPIAIALVAILGFIFTAIPGTQYSANILDALKGIPGLGSAQQDLLRSATNSLAKSAGFLAIIAVLLALFGGSRLFVAMEGCMSIVYRVRPRPFLKQNAIAIGMMLIFTILIPIMVFAATLPLTLLNLVNNNPSLKAIPFLSTLAENAITAQIGGYIGGLIAAFLLFEAIYVIVPNQRISIRNSWQGALAAGVLLEIFIALFPVYTARAMGNYQGQIGFAVVLLAFFYYFAVILMLGAEVNAFFFEKIRPLPNNLATFVCTMAGKLNQDRPDAESPTHVDTEPTERADSIHIARVRQEEEQNQRHNMQRQQEIAHQHMKMTEHKDKNKQPGKGSTTLAVVAGSLLAMVIEMLRIRNGK
ncbi:YihY/virulence factor BrkB family protein [Dictyobacter formicarum]|uniref:YihY/virulence factor BrkB family protein n=1 Tax=Dictyobacter formicarum TaxID=2778368 RepID=A0ABQ3V9S3_9CHLR|nr:YihY/virulence factor BrkB family protein [Dictyobacter formicarum]GHO82887.1 hypothetical protein KSZ_08930 [Dictyobacter formicarum]